MKSIGEGIFKSSGCYEFPGPFLFGARVIGNLVLFFMKINYLRGKEGSLPGCFDLAGLFLQG